MPIVRRLWLLLSTFAWLVGGVVSASERPNVILILTDDQGYGDMSCHGNPWLKTPHLDRLASESVQLEDYHVDPVCTPTRAALMTGRYSSRVGAWAVTEGRQLLGKREVTMADAFSRSGYRTAMFGKWHLGDTWPYAPRYRGFQVTLRHLAGGIDEIGNPIGNDYYDDTYYRNGVPETIPGYCTDVFFGECERFIRDNSEKPFFIYLPLNAMHSPHTVPDRYADPFRRTGHSEKRAKFFGQIVNFDENLGRLLEELEATSLEDNTIVIFMGDNGTAAGLESDGFNAGMRGKKGSVFEGGHRVACFVRWPRRLAKDRRVDELTSCRDWFPTLAHWCELAPPSDLAFDGRSLHPLLESSDSAGSGSEASDSQWSERTLFVERQGDQPSLERVPGQRYPQYAVLTQRWRLVNGQLFEIGRDPGQQADVSAENKSVVEALRKMYETHHEEVFSEGQDYQRFQLGAADENPTLLTVRDWHPTTGRVIWQQPQLGDDELKINGFWEVDVTRKGRYRIRLARFPDDAPAPMRASHATLLIGQHQREQTLRPEDSSAVFELDLDEGPHRLQTWLRDETSGERGAYFVLVERLKSED